MCLSDSKKVSKGRGLESRKCADGVNKIRNISEYDISRDVTSFEINELDEIQNSSEIFSTQRTVKNCKNKEIKKEVLLGFTAEREKSKL